MYKVFKDHAELAEYKTLVAAKKLAEKEHGEVFCDGTQVYPVIATTMETNTPDSTVATQSEEADSTGAITSALADSTDDKHTEDVGGRYRIESLMNVRLHPALNADIVGITQPGTVVTVTGIEDDWMAVKNGNETVYIMYGGGRYATRV